MFLVTQVRQIVKALTLLIATLATVNPSFAFTYSGDYLPFDKQHLGEAFPQKEVIASISRGDKTSSDGVSIKAQDHSIILSSKDVYGKKWTMKADVLAAGGCVYCADLDANGKQDFILWLGTCACGIAPPARLVIVMIDKNLRPHSYEAVGYFGYGKHGVEDLRKIQGSNNAILIQQSLAGDVTFKNHYWRTTVWQAQPKCRWTEKRYFGGAQLPAHVFYAAKPNHKTSHPKIYTKDLEDDSVHPLHSNS